MARACRQPHGDRGLPAGRFHQRTPDVVGNRLGGAVQSALLEVAAEVGQEAPGRVED